MPSNNFSLEATAITLIMDSSLFPTFLSFLLYFSFWIEASQISNPVDLFIEPKDFLIGYNPCQAYLCTHVKTHEGNTVKEQFRAFIPINFSTNYLSSSLHVALCLSIMLGMILVSSVKINSK